MALEHSFRRWRRETYEALRESQARADRAQARKNLRIGCRRKIIERDHEHRAPIDLRTKAGDKLMRQASGEEVAVRAAQAAPDEFR